MTANDKSREAFEAFYEEKVSPCFEPQHQKYSPNHAVFGDDVRSAWLAGIAFAQQHQEPPRWDSKDELFNKLTVEYDYVPIGVLMDIYDFCERQHQAPRKVDVHGVCSNKPRPSVQNNHSKGNQYWEKDVWHIRKSGAQTMCGIDSSEWLDMGELSPDSNLCDRCKKIALQPKPSTEVAGDVVERVARAIYEVEPALTAKGNKIVPWERVGFWFRARAVSRAEAAIAALSRSEVKQENGWRDVESAPKDTAILVWGKLNEWGSWSVHETKWDSKLNDFPSWYLTHWRPIPAPPVQSEGSK